MNTIDIAIERMLIEDYRRLDDVIGDRILRVWDGDERLTEVLFKSLLRCGWNHLVMMN